MEGRLERARAQIEALRRAGTVAYWKLSFAENLQRRTGEYLALGMEAEAGETCARLESWLARHAPKVPEKSRKPKPILAFDANYLRRSVQEILATLEGKKRLIPAPERSFAKRKLESLDPLFEAGKLGLLHEEILSIRSSLITRLVRSYRARAAFRPQVPGTVRRAPSANVGIYNSRQTLETALSLIGERDPIWVEDCLALYSEIFRYAELLAQDPAGKRRKR